jgi:hypothetical protein
VPDHRHSAKNAYIALVTAFFLSLSHSLTTPHAAHAVAALDAAGALHAAPSAATPLPSPAARLHAVPSAACPHAAGALDHSPPSTSTAPTSTAATSSTLHAGRRARDRPPPPVSPATRRHARDPPSRPRPDLQGDCLLLFCDIVIKKLLCSTRMIYIK